MDFMIGKPYSFRLFNCWDYVSEIRKQNGIKTKLFQPLNLDNAFEIITAEMQKLGSGLTKVNSHKDFDIIIVSKITNSKKTYHCGLIYGDNVLHCSRALKQVVCESFNSFNKEYDGFTLWR